MTPTLNSYFAGCGLIEIGLQQGGCELQQSFEIDLGCCATHRLNFKHEIVCGDITQKLVKADKPADVKVFTYPCNKYAEIAAIHKARTGDELFLHALRHIAGLLPHSSPTGPAKTGPERTAPGLTGKLHSSPNPTRRKVKREKDHSQNAI